MELFSAREVSKSFVNHRALDNVSMSVPEKSIYGLLGPNGAGKTTLIRIINQITAPDTGEIRLNGRSLKPGDIYRIGYMPEERGLYKKMKVGEQALYFARLKGLDKKTAMKRLRYWFEKFEIQSWWNKKVEELSKGMQQKVQFIITILHEPELLIFDEPFSGFDPINTNLLKNEINGIRDRGATIIFSTHNMSSVEELCDHITLINNSKSVIEGSVNHIRNQFKLDIYRIGFEGDAQKLYDILSPAYEVLELTGGPGGHHARIKVHSKSTDNMLLKLLMPHFHITSFTEEIPSMNDIFIDLVSQQKTKVNN
ncbi:MAG: ATP-binding cassette domain-containing protein [Marinilabiliales bacterium]|nr:MAG: ATP-binding cassette domain-containing protein [Marinilabiliales bacterium]